jgi:hypothetical protein
MRPHVLWAGRAKKVRVRLGRAFLPQPPMIEPGDLEVAPKKARSPKAGSRRVYKFEMPGAVACMGEVIFGVATNETRSSCRCYSWRNADADAELQAEPGGGGCCCLTK